MNQILFQEKSYPSLKNFCESNGFAYNNVKSRLQRGWSLEEACKHTKNPSKKHKGPHVKNRLKEIEKGEWECSFCGVVKTKDSFFKVATSIGGYSRQCKTCNRRRYQVTKYGLTLEKYEEFIKKQESKCACCKKPLEDFCSGQGKKTICVDHDHNTGVVRGLLCGLCNTGIGALGDNIEGLKKALKYLEDHYGQT